MKVWDALLAALREFPDAVLTGVDPEGYPVSLRCRPEPDAAEQILRVTAPTWLRIQPGQASLMSHSHDDQLWSLKGFLARGTLRVTEGTLLFQPVRFSRTAGAGLSDALNMVLGTRRSTTTYLKRRGLPRPQIPWHTIHAAKQLLKNPAQDR